MKLGNGAQFAAGGTATAAGPGDPLAGIEQVLQGLAAVNGWLAAADPSAVSPDVLQGVLVGLGHADAAACAARARAIVACEEAGLPSADGSANPSAWTGVQLRLTGAAAARECAFAATLVGMPEVLAALGAGRISVAHAEGVVAARRQQQADTDAAEAARAARERQEAAARRAAAEAEAARLADAAERAAALAAAAAQEREQARAAAAAAEARRAAARAEAERKQAELLARAARGQSPDQVRRHARDQRRTDPDALERDAVAQHTRRSVRSWVDGETGMGMVRMALPAEVYEKWLTALEAARTLDPAETPMAERRTAEQRDADAVIDLIDLALRTGQLPTSGGVTPHLVIYAHAQTMADEGVAGRDAPGRARYGTDMAAEAVRRAGCDADFTRLITTPQGQPLDVGRTTRQWTVAQRRAIEARDGGCRFPIAPGQNCGRPVGWTQIHHVVWWRRNGKTAIDNGVLLCARHHHAVHHDGWNLALADTGLVTVSRTGPDGRPILRTSPPAGPLHRP